LHGFDDAGKFREDAVAGRAHEAPAALPDELADRFAMARERGEGRRLVGRHEAAVADDIGGENGGQATFHGKPCRWGRAWPDVRLTTARRPTGSPAALGTMNTGTVLAIGYARAGRLPLPRLQGRLLVFCRRLR